MHIWVTSDSHFNHANIIALCNRPFTCVDIMNECLIENWNARVSKEDLVIHCGDFAFGTAQKKLMKSSIASMDAKFS